MTAPQTYLGPKPTSCEPANTGATYTCPMHAEIRLQSAGSCRICGMTLVPLQVTAEAAPNHEPADLTQRWIGLVLAFPVVVFEMGLTMEDLSDFSSVTGQGVTRACRRTDCLNRGNARLMADRGIELGDLVGQADELRRQGATALFVKVDGKPGGVIVLADPIKASTRAALDSLRADGIHVVMLMGDNRTTAEAVARQLGIDDVEADVLLEDKNRIVMFVGHIGTGIGAVRITDRRGAATLGHDRSTHYGDRRHRTVPARD